MISQREFIRKYTRVLESKQDFDSAGKKIPFEKKTVCFQCRVCKSVLKTKKDFPGILPKVLKCEVCDGIMGISEKDLAPEAAPTYEWNRPNFQAVWDLRKKAPSLMNNILNHSLLIYKIENE